jgi:lipopolysaccharide/colanic/teichoic acid biosynthesis glycosyltransferase
MEDVQMRQDLRVQRATKRALDVVLGGLLSVAIAPVVLTFAVVTAICLRANPFFLHRRPGHDGRMIPVVKIRTLPPSTPVYGNKFDLDLAHMPLPRWCVFLRRTHLDELPQIFQVLLGHLSLVGPRPRLPDVVEPIDAEYDGVRRHVRQGCSGLWQISCASSQVASAGPEFDLFYLRFASVRFDLWILARTFLLVGGLSGPVTIDDVPDWVLGDGLVLDAELDRLERRLLGKVVELRDPVFDTSIVVDLTVTAEAG